MPRSRTRSHDLKWGLGAHPSPLSAAPAADLKPDAGLKRRGAGLAARPSEWSVRTSDNWEGSAAPATATARAATLTRDRAREGHGAAGVDDRERLAGRRRSDLHVVAG